MDWSASGTAYVAYLDYSSDQIIIKKSSDPANGTAFTYIGSLFGGNVDQPWISVVNANQMDQIYVGVSHDNLATVYFSLNSGNTWNQKVLDQAPGIGGDSSARVVASADGKRVYALFERYLDSTLALGRTEEAFSDVKLMLYLTDASRQEPILISQLVRMEQMQLALEPIAHGMRQWSDPQLQEFQRRLGQFNFCADTKRALEAERAVFGGGVIDFLRRSPDQYNALASNESELPAALFVAMPSGWFDFEKLNYYRLFESYMAPAVDLNNCLVNPTSVQQAEQRIGTILAKSPGALFLRHRFFARVLIPSLAGIFRKTAFGQEGVNAASIACALERYRRAHGKFPDALDALMPQLADKLPKDIITGQPLYYRERAIPGVLGWLE